MNCSTCEILRENERLRVENAELKLELENAKEGAKQLERRVKQLGRRLAKYEKMREVRRLTRSKRREYTIARFPGKPRGSPGATRPVPKPDAVIEADELKSCTECGAELGPPVHNRERILEELPDVQPTHTVLYREFHYLCGGCGSEIVARHRECPPSGRFGKNVYVQTTLLKFAQRLPLAKVCSVLERQGLEITEPTALALLDRASFWLRPEYEQIIASIRASEVVYLDQTGIKVDGVNFWIWDFVGDSDVTDQGTLFAIRDNKSQKVLEEVLGRDWDGTMVCDGLRSHHSYARKSGAKIQRCWSHLLDDAKKLAETHAEAKALNEGLHRIFNRLKKALENGPPPEERARVARNAKLAMRRLWSKRYRKSKVREFIEKIRRGYPYWFTFATTPGVEPTNNRAERALRELVVQRKIIGTLRNEKGTRMYETLPTLLATWKQRGLNLREALSNAFTKAWQSGRDQA
jgi:transposase/lambda repressor-like predicted transcriptional regulator